MAKVNIFPENIKSLFFRFEFIYLCACLLSSPPQDQTNPDVKIISPRILDFNSHMQPLSCKLNYHRFQVSTPACIVPKQCLFLSVLQHFENILNLIAD